MAREIKTPRITRKSSTDPPHLNHDYNYSQVLTLDLLKEFTLEEVSIRNRGGSFVIGRYLLKVLPTPQHLARIVRVLISTP